MASVWRSKIPLNSEGAARERSISSASVSFRQYRRPSLTRDSASLARPLLVHGNTPGAAIGPGAGGETAAAVAGPSAGSGRRADADEREVAVATGVVEPVADDE